MQMRLINGLPTGKHPLVHVPPGFHFINRVGGRLAFEQAGEDDFLRRVQMHPDRRQLTFSGDSFQRTAYPIPQAG